MNRPCNSDCAYWAKPRLQSFVSRRQMKRRRGLSSASFPDKRFSFVDCTSFTIMQRLGIGTAFAFDDDFRRLGKWMVEPIIEES